MSDPATQPAAIPRREPATPPHRAFILLAVFIALVGTATPALALLRSGGLRGSLNDAALMLAFWGLSPFVLLPVAARVAKRPSTRRLVILLGGLAALFGVLGHFAGMVPKVPNANDSLAFIFIPVWQWPLLLLATVIALFVPASTALEQGSPAGDGSPGQPASPS